MNHASPHSHPSHRASRVCAARFDASSALLGDRHHPSDDGAETEPGRFSMEPAVLSLASPRHRASRIGWGARLRDEGDRVLVRIDGRWRDVAEVAGIGRNEICWAYKTLFRGDARVPDSWVFNDFGRATLFYLSDDDEDVDGARNAIARSVASTAPSSSSTESATLLWVNKKMDPAGALAAVNRRYNILYPEGCISVQADDLDEMVANGYVAHGNLVVVHPYPDRSMAVATAPAWSEPPYELHFYPEEGALYVYGWQARPLG